ncbi:MAG TPA: hypothetical protein PKY05_12295 [Fibrobacteria bacterium]|nr:hypothetical protein [Fibrobacteria bacterium]
MQKLRFLPLAAMTLALSLFTGCDDEDGSVTINGFTVSNATPAAGTSIDARGTADFETDNATVTYSVSGTNAATVIEVPAPFKVAAGASIGKQISIKAGATGSYTLSVKVVDEDGAEATASTSFCVGSCSGTGSTPLDRVGSVDLGSQADPTNGSFLDVDGGIAYTSGSKTAAETAEIDLVFFKDNAGTASFLSPSQVVADGLNTLSGWANKNSTVIVDAGTTAITTVEGAKSAVGSSSSQKAAVVSGHYYAMKLTGGEYAVVKATSMTASGVTVTVEIFSE